MYRHSAPPPASTASVSACDTSAQAGPYTEGVSRHDTRYCKNGSLGKAIGGVQHRVVAVQRGHSPIDDVRVDIAREHKGSTSSGRLHSSATPQSAQGRPVAARGGARPAPPASWQQTARRTPAATPPGRSARAPGLAALSSCHRPKRRGSFGIACRGRQQAGHFLRHGRVAHPQQQQVAAKQRQPIALKKA